MEIQSVKPKQARRQPRIVVRGFKGREPATEKIARLTDFRGLWERLSHINNHNELYNATLSSVADLEVTSSDVEKFCVEIEKMQNEEGFPWRAGIMISALVNSSVDSDFIIPVRIFEGKLSLLAFRNRKNVFIDGDAGDGFAAQMEAGIATVHGNVYGGVGEGMTGGTAIAEQDVYGRVGACMAGGEINVKGDVGILGYNYGFSCGNGPKRIFIGDPMFAVGLEMEDGFINIEGFSGALTGLYQKGGVIKVGYAGSVVGSKRSGGEIYIENDYESISSKPGGGVIFYGEKQIHPKKKNGEDKVLAELIGAWYATPFDAFDLERSYSEAFQLARMLTYTGDDVGNFARALPLCRDVGHFHTKAGVFLSALVNAGEGLFYSLNLEKTPGISKVGFRNSKIVRVKGNLGPHAASESVGGSSMIVEGNVGYAAGAWGNGALLVTCDAGDFTGLGARGGYIEILGSAGKNAGEFMDGGCIYVHGLLKGVGNVRNGLVQLGDEIIIQTK